MYDRYGSATVAGAAGLAGCSGGEGSPTESASSTPDSSPTATSSPSPTDSATPTDSPTPTSTPEQIDGSDLEFVGSVVRQPSEDAPGQVRASLTNRSGKLLQLFGGAPAPLSPRIDDGPDDALILFPDQDDAINEYSWRDEDGNGESVSSTKVADATYEDCWHAPADGLLRTDLADATELPDGLTVDADFYPLAAADADCPEGGLHGSRGADRSQYGPDDPDRTHRPDRRRRPVRRGRNVRDRRRRRVVVLRSPSSPPAGSRSTGRTLPAARGTVFFNGCRATNPQ